MKLARRRSARFGRRSAHSGRERPRALCPPGSGAANLWAVAALFVLLAVLTVGAVAVLALKRAEALLSERTPPVLFEVDEAIEFVARALPAEQTARLSYEDVEALLGWHLVHLAGRDQGVDIGDEQAVADLVARAGVEGRGIGAADVRAVLAAEGEYLAAIGALGPEAT